MAQSLCPVHLSWKNTARLIQVIYGINTMWHFCAFYFFVWRGRGILRKYMQLPLAEVTTARGARTANHGATLTVTQRLQPVAPTVAVDAMRFLGAMNSGYALLSGMALVRSVRAGRVRASDAAVLAMANFSQFAMDVVMHRNGLARRALWQITGGDLFCFVVDSLLCAYILWRGRDLRRAERLRILSQRCASSSGSGAGDAHRHHRHHHHHEQQQPQQQPAEQREFKEASSAAAGAAPSTVSSAADAHAHVHV